MAAVSRMSSPVGIIVRSSLPYAGGELVAVKYPNKPVRVLFVDKHGEVSYPMLTKDNKKEWDCVVSFVS